MKSFTFSLILSVTVAVQFDYRIATKQGLMEFNSTEKAGSVMFINYTFYGGCKWLHTDKDVIDLVEESVFKLHNPFEFFLPTQILEKVYGHSFTKNETKDFYCGSANRRFTANEEQWIKQNHLIPYPKHGYYVKRFFYKGPFNGGYLIAEQNNKKDGYFQYTNKNNEVQKCKWNALTLSTLRKLRTYKCARTSPMRFFTEHIYKGYHRQMHGYIYSLPEGDNELVCS